MNVNSELSVLKQFYSSTNVMEINFGRKFTFLLLNEYYADLYYKSIYSVLMDDFQHLLNQCKELNRKACLSFYDMFYVNVYNSCFRILNNQMEAEEVMQDTFIKVFQHLDRFSGNQKMMQAYLRKIAIHHSTHLLKKQKNIVFSELNEAMDEVVDQSYDCTLIEEWQVEKIKACIQKLPSGYKLIINLHLIEEMEYDDIAAMLDIKASSVRSQYTRALKKLKQLLK